MSSISEQDPPGEGKQDLYQFKSKVMVPTSHFLSVKIT